MDNLNITKQDNNTIEVVKNVEPQTVSYTYEELLTSKAFLTQEREAYLANSDKKLAELDHFIAEADRLGVDVKAEVPVKEVAEEVLSVEESK